MLPGVAGTLSRRVFEHAALGRSPATSAMPQDRPVIVLSDAFGGERKQREEWSTH